MIEQEFTLLFRSQQFQGVNWARPSSGTRCGHPRKEAHGRTARRLGAASRFEPDHEIIFAAKNSSTPIPEQ